MEKFNYNSNPFGGDAYVKQDAKDVKKSTSMFSFSGLNATAMSSIEDAGAQSAAFYIDEQSEAKEIKKSEVQADVYEYEYYAGESLWTSNDNEYNYEDTEGWEG